MKNLFFTLSFFLILGINTSKAQTEKDLYGTWILEDMKIEIPDTVSAETKQNMENMINSILIKSKGKVSINFKSDGSYIALSPDDNEGEISEEGKEEKGTWKYDSKNKILRIVNNNGKEEPQKISLNKERNQMIINSDDKENSGMTIIFKKR